METTVLDDIIRDVVWNNEICYQLRQYLHCISPQGKDDGSIDIKKAELYDGLVKYQIMNCVDNRSCIAWEGFHVGEPWNGDIVNAPTLFLSSNPGYSFDDVHPRYNAATGKVYCPVKLRLSRGNVSQCCDSCPFRENKSKPCSVDNGELNPNAVQYYFRTRMQKLKAPVLDGKNKSVRYWSNVCNQTAILLEGVVPNLSSNLKSRKIKELIMQSVVSMEVVPFKSKKEGKLLSYEVMEDCWERFTIPIIKLAGAKVIVLVGGDENRDGEEKEMGEKEKLFRNKLNLKEGIHVHERKIGGKRRLIVRVPFNSGKTELLTNLVNATVNPKSRKQPLPPQYHLYKSDLVTLQRAVADAIPENLRIKLEEAV